MLEREFRRLGLLDIDLELLYRDLEFRSLEDLYVGLGCGDVSLGRIINKISESDKQKTQDLLVARPSLGESKKTDETTVTVLGLKGILTSIARCCNPVPGDEIVGYITRGRGATIHRQDCPNVLRLNDRERLVKVSWGEPHATYPVSIQIKAYDRQGLMGDISNILLNEDVNILDVKIKVSHNFAYIFITVEVGDIAQLSRVLTRIENLPNVMQAQRIKPG